MTQKKLYIVTVEYEAYVLAEDYEAAEDFAKEIVSTQEPFVDCLPVTGDPPNPLKWPPHCCIFHSEQDQRDILVSEVT